MIPARWWWQEQLSVLYDDILHVAAVYDAAVYDAAVQSLCGITSRGIGGRV
jgi:hypothetical protein